METVTMTVDSASVAHVNGDSAPIEKAKRTIIPVKDFIAAYQKSSEAGHTMAQFAESVGLKVGSAIARVSALRGELKDRGMKPSQINKVLPSLTRKERDGGNRAEFLDSLVAEVNVDELESEKPAV